MKIVIFSDSHGDAETMRGVVENERPDMILYLGDGIADARALRAKYPAIPMIEVLGNVDSQEADEAWIKFTEVCGKRFIITHGHTFITEFSDGRQTDANRITSRNDMLKCMDDHHADVLLHGHTHEPYMNRTQVSPGRTCWIVNPGSIRRQRGGANPAYCVLKLDDSGTFEWRFVELESMG